MRLGLKFRTPLRAAQHLLLLPLRALFRLAIVVAVLGVGAQFIQNALVIARSSGTWKAGAGSSLKAIGAWLNPVARARTSAASPSEPPITKPAPPFGRMMRCRSVLSKPSTARWPGARASNWAIGDGQQYAGPLGYAPLPAEIVALDKQALAGIK